MSLRYHALRGSWLPRVRTPAIAGTRLLRIILLSLLTPLASAQTPTETAAGNSYTNAIRFGDAYYQRGQPARALSEWSRAYELAKKEGGQEQTIGALARRAEAYTALGYYENAAGDLNAGAQPG